MTKQQLDSWLKFFGRAWSEQNIDKVMSLFDKDDITYYESVFDPPITSWKSVEKLWEVVHTNQKDITFTHKIILCSKNQGIVNWKVSRFFIPTNENQRIDGIFQISLNRNGLCTFFKQWRMVKGS